ncbi:MAG TPA: helix-turn-helix transcriptional regulator [Thermohalobaculum sp.]|nr:helix-turn-helix transcriptional regulator [Thermohalobaculum sp.]
MAHPLDVLVGKRLRQRRLKLGMTAQELGDRVGVTGKQIEKYETGADRISASGIWDVAAVVDVPVLFFFDGVDGQSTHTVGDCDDLVAAQTTLYMPSSARGAVNVSNLGNSGSQAFAAALAMCGGFFKTAARSN